VTDDTEPHADDPAEDDDLEEPEPKNDPIEEPEEPRAD